LSENLNFWYNNFANGTLTSELPAQALPSSKKKDTWKKSVMDSLESIGLKQFEENTRFLDYYKMCENKVSYTELSDLIPQLREVENILEDFDIPSTIKHYDILGIILNYLQSVIAENKDKFTPTNIDEISSNEYIRDKTEFYRKFISEEWGKELKIKLVNVGLYPDRQDFESEEEKAQYIQAIQAKQEELTPPQIEDYMNKNWRTTALSWAEHTIEADTERFRINEIDRENIAHYLKTGKCFQHFFINHDSYGTEAWHPVQVFYSQTLDVKYPQKGEYIGRVHFYTPSDFINREGHHFSEKVTRQILNTNVTENTEGKTLSNSLHKIVGVPHVQHEDYQFMLGIQEHFGVPLANKTIFKKDGTSETIRDFLPDTFKGTNGNSANRYARLLRPDINLRTDMIMVTEAYFRSYQLIGYITFVTETGMVESEIITDDLLPEFLEEYGIKELRNVSLEEFKKDRQPNTVVWAYRPQIWKGKKASTAMTNLKEDLYYEIEPLPFQIKGDSNIYDLMLPVAGIVSPPPADKIIPWQNFYNIVTNSQYNLLEKEIGLFFTFDINFLPSDIKQYGDTETTLINFKNIVKDTGLFGVDASSQNLQGKNAFNQFAAHDLSLTNQIAAKQQQAEYFKQKAYEQFGLTPQALGEPVKYQTAEGVKQNASATNSQTDYLYEDFSNFKSRALEIHLNVAQFAQGDGRDISVNYTKGDMSKAFLRFSDENFPLRQFGIMYVSNSKKRKELETIRSYMLNQNTMDTDSLELISLVTSDSVAQLMEIARLERIRKERNATAQQQHEQSLLAQQAQLEEEKAQKEWERKEYSAEQERNNKIELKRLEGLGRAVDDNGSQEGLNFISQEADRALEREQNEKQNEQKDKELDIKLNDLKEKYKNNEAVLSAKMKELALKEKQIENDKFIAIINKN